jgi:hypothetical protein
MDQYQQNMLNLICYYHLLSQDLFVSWASRNLMTCAFSRYFKQQSLWMIHPRRSNFTDTWTIGPMNWGASLHHGWQGHIDMLIYVDIQWMEEILHQLIGSLSHYL